MKFASTIILVFLATNVNATPIHVSGEFAITEKSSTGTQGPSYHGSFEGSISNASIAGTGSTFFQKSRFHSFEATLFPQVIGNTIFDDSNLDIQLHFMNGEFYQLWFGGNSLGANGIKGGTDDFFVQWYRQVDTPPSTGYVSTEAEGRQVSINGGNLTITVPEPNVGSFVMFVTLFLSNQRRRRRANRSQCWRRWRSLVKLGESR